ncbi:hypothetical protein V6Z12_A09G109600 [Gossypium hirsutum]
MAPFDSPFNTNADLPLKTTTDKCGLLMIIFGLKTSFSTSSLTKQREINGRSISWPLLVYSNAGMAVRRRKETRKGGHARSLSWEPNSLAFQKLLVLSTAVFRFGCIRPRWYVLLTIVTGVSH